MEDARRGVAAVVVHYRDPDAVRSCLESLRASSRPVDLVVVIDNSAGIEPALQFEARGRATAWSDGHVTGRLLASASPGPDLVLEADDNLGPGSAFAAGLRIAEQKGMAMAWLLDQDMRPTPDCLSKLVEGLADGAEVAVPQRVNAQGLRYRQFAMRRWVLRKVTDRRARRPMDIHLAVYSGMLVRCLRAAAAAIPVDFFIDGDDQALCSRLEAQGHRIVFAPEAVARHESGDLRKKAGIPVGGWAAFRSYYVARNARHVFRELRRRHPGPAAWLLVRTLAIFTALGLLTAPRRLKLRNLARGWVDGGRGIKGKRPDRALGSPA